jgi:hypothetical protein
MSMDYITAIGLGFPGVEASCFSDPNVYENIIWEAGLAMPSKETLDAWISSNGAMASQTKITVLAFRNRFTQTEKVTIDMASIDNPAASMPQRQLAASLRVMNADLAVASFVDLSRADTRAGVQQLETFGIIGTGRATAILDTPPTAIELARD